MVPRVAQEGDERLEGALAQSAALAQQRLDKESAPSGNDETLANELEAAQAALREAEGRAAGEATRWT